MEWVGGVIKYTPNRDYHGVDQIDYRVEDGRGGSAAGRIRVLVTPVNDPPVLRARPVFGSYGAPVPLEIDGTDADGDSLSYRVQVPPRFGTLTGKLPNAIYQPNLGFSGSDTVVVVANDGAVDSAPLEIPIRVVLHLAVGASPVALDHVGSQRVELVDSPLHGNVEVTGNGELLYRHALDGVVLDSLRYHLISGTGVVDKRSAAVHVVGLHSLIFKDGHIKVTFPTVAGLRYRVETSTESPHATGAWRAWYRADATTSTTGFLTTAVRVPPGDSSGFIRLVCESADQTVISEPWGIQCRSVAPGIDGRVFTAWAAGEPVLGCRVSRVEGSTLELDSGAVLVPSMMPTELGASHVVFLRSSEDSGDRRNGIGTWWPIVHQDGHRLGLDDSIESVMNVVRAGDFVECVRLNTVADVFGTSDSASMSLLKGDRIEMDDFRGERVAVHYGSVAGSGNGYWFIRDGYARGPYDGTTIPLLPFQSFHFSARQQAGFVLTMGRINGFPMVRYLIPGVRMAGNALPVATDLHELEAYRLGGEDWPWLDGGAVPPVTEPYWGAKLGEVPAAEGVWLRIPESSGVVRWVQQPPL